MFWIIIIGIIIAYVAYVAFVSLIEGFVPISMCIIAMLSGMSIIAIIAVILSVIRNKEKRCLVFLSIITVSIMIFISALFLKELWIVMSSIAIGTFILSLVCINYLTSKSKKEAKEISLIKNKIEKIEKKIKGLPNKNNNTKTEELKNEIKGLIWFFKSLFQEAGEGDRLICEDIIKKLREIEKILGDFGNPQKNNKKKELVGIIDSLRVYIDVIDSTPDGILLSEIDRNIDDKKKNIEQKKTLSVYHNEREEQTEQIIELRDKITKLRDKKIEILSKEPVGVLDKHEIRRSLTISLTIVYFMLLFFSIFSPVTTTTQFINMTDMIPGNISGDITVGNVTITATADNTNITLSNTTTHTTPNLQSPFIEVFTYIYLAVIAFYFGSRAVETYAAMKKK